MEIVSEVVKAELAPSGVIRVGLNHQNFLLVLGDGPDGSPTGIAPDLGRELGRRAGMPVRFVRFEKAGLLANAAANGAWDIAFLGSEPERASQIAFSAAYLEIPVTFLVGYGSPIQKISDLDRVDIRIAVAEKSAYDLYLTRSFKRARLVRVPGIDESFNLFTRQSLDALAGLKPRLIIDAENCPVHAF